ncbi:MAG: alpha/beta hydrolase, partial [Bacteroidales bacterium]|nr:alpha/beta hydrolase [Bacteroidales bacterium]
WFDRFDVTTWAKVAHDIFQDDFMVIHGVSMGAATVMMMSGDPQPEYVRAYVEDCGYSSAWDQFAYNLKDSFHLPPFPILNSASIVSKNRYGWSFKEASSVKQLANCDRPMFFIHGDADDFVPFDHLWKNYEAKVQGYKDYYVCPGAVHANSYAKDPATYKAKVAEFLANVKRFIANGTYPNGDLPIKPSARK